MKAPLPLLFSSAAYWYNNAATCLVYEVGGRQRSRELVHVCGKNFRRPAQMALSRSCVCSDKVKVET